MDFTSLLSCTASTEMLSKIETYYSQALSNSLTVLCAMFGIVALIVPILQEWRAQRNLNNAKKELAGAVENQIRRVGEALSAMQSESKYVFSMVSGGQMHVQGRLERLESNYSGAAFCFLRAATLLKHGGHVELMKSAMRDALIVITVNMGSRVDDIVDFEEMTKELLDGIKIDNSNDHLMVKGLQTLLKHYK